MILENLARDIRQAGRGLGRSPGFAIAVVLTLALGIGGNTAVFSVVDQLLVRSLPIHHGVSPVERHGHQRHHARFSNARTFSGKRLQGGIDKIDPAYYPVSPMAMGTTARREAAVDVGGTRGLPRGAAIVLRLLNPSR